MENLSLPGPGKVTEIIIFKHLWAVLPKKSYISGLWLREFENTPFFLNIFAHVLPKRQNAYPYFVHYFKNITLLTPGEHALLDQGTEEQRIQYALDLEQASGGKQTADWGKLKKLEEDLKKEYREHFPVTKFGIIGYKYDAQTVYDTISMLNKKFLAKIQ